jgi:hypothetical protein
MAGPGWNAAARRDQRLSVLVESSEDEFVVVLVNQAPNEGVLDGVEAVRPAARRAARTAVRPVLASLRSGRSSRKHLSEDIERTIVSSTVGPVSGLSTLEASGRHSVAAPT